MKRSPRGRLGAQRQRRQRQPISGLAGRKGNSPPSAFSFPLNRPETRRCQRKQDWRRARPPGTGTGRAHSPVPVRAHTHAYTRTPTHQQPLRSRTRVGRRLQRLSPRLLCGLDIRLAAAAPAALAFARRHCSQVLWHPAWRRLLACLGHVSSPSTVWTDGALLVPLAPAARVVHLLLLPFAGVVPQSPGKMPLSHTHAQAS